MYYNEFETKCDNIIKDIVTLKSLGKIKESKIRTLDLLNLKFEYYTQLKDNEHNRHSNGYKYVIDTLGSWLNNTGIYGQIKRLENELYIKYNFIEE